MPRNNSIHALATAFGSFVGDRSDPCAHGTNSTRGGELEPHRPTPLPSSLSDFGGEVSLDLHDSAYKARWFCSVYTAGSVYRLAFGWLVNNQSNITFLTYFYVQVSISVCFFAVVF